MLFEALIHLTFSLLNISFSLSFESPLYFLEFLYALVPQCEVLLSHFADKRLDITCLFLQCLGVLIILLLQLFMAITSTGSAVLHTNIRCTQA